MALINTGTGYFSLASQSTDIYPWNKKAKDRETRDIQNSIYSSFTDKFYNNDLVYGNDCDNPNLDIKTRKRYVIKTGKNQLNDISLAQLAYQLSPLILSALEKYICKYGYVNKSVKILVQKDGILDSILLNDTPTFSLKDGLMNYNCKSPVLNIFLAQHKNFQKTLFLPLNKEIDNLYPYLLSQAIFKEQLHNRFSELTNMNNDILFFNGKNGTVSGKYSANVIDIYECGGGVIYLIDGELY